MENPICRLCQYCNISQNQGEEMVTREVSCRDRVKLLLLGANTNCTAPRSFRERNPNTQSSAESTPLV